MKKILSILFLLVFMVLVLLPFLKSQFQQNEHYLNFNSVQELQEFLAWGPEKVPLIGAHRGGPMEGYPENCIATFQNSVKYWKSLIECDVRITADEKLVMMHDKTLNRTTTDTGLVSEKTLRELQELYLKDSAGNKTDYRIPTLDDVFEWGRGKAIIELDVKRGVSAEKIVAAIQKNNAFAYTVVITYNLNQLKTYADLHPDLMLSATAKSVDGFKRILETGIDPKRLVVFVGVGEPAPDLYKLLHQHNIRSILGTMHNIDNSALKRGASVYQKVLQNGADILATDNVPLATEGIKAFIKGN